jgi:hypothetical protein
MDPEGLASDVVENLLALGAQSILDDAKVN